MERIYLYLGKRNKQGLKVLAVLKGDYCAPVRVQDIKSLGLSKTLEQKIIQQIYQDRMLWEPWIQSAKDYSDLKKTLTNMGYTGLPLCASPMFEITTERVIQNNNEVMKKEGVINIQKQQKTMLRRKD